MEEIRRKEGFKRHLTHRKKAFKHKRKKELLASYGIYTSGYYIDGDRLKKCYLGRADLKRMANKAVRRKPVKLKGGEYKKIYDYWWKVL